MRRQVVQDRAKEIAKFVQREFKAKTDAKRAVEMAAYMKTSMPFYGVQKPDRQPIYKHIIREFPPRNHDEFEVIVRTLWAMPHREEKYTALEFANAFQLFVDSKSVPLFEDLIREGAWWDFVDVIAINLIGHAYLRDRSGLKSEIERFNNDSDFWVRRTALICQNHHKKQTDEKQLLRFCLSQAEDKEFFIRKAIGWALREYSYVKPDAVKEFVEQNQTVLSPLSRREALKRVNALAMH
jgi:3-methyladenine DNA glycosylase AlkD